MKFIMSLATLGFMITLVYAVVLKIRKKPSKKMFVNSLIFLGVMFISFFFVDDKEPIDKKVATESKEASTTPKVEKKEEQKNDETEQEIENYKKIYDEKIKPFMTEYDKIWNENWKPAMNKISNDPNKFKEIKGEMDKVQEGYDNLNLKIIDWKAKGLNDDNNKQLEEYRENFSQAVSYRSNAARAINQAIDGVADLESRFEEAKKSIELSDKYVLNAAVTLTKLENKLGLIKEEEK